MDPHALALLTLWIAFPLTLLAAALLGRKWQEAPELRVLRQQFLTAVAVTCVTLFFGVIFINNDRVVPWVGLDTTKWITRLAILLLALISAVGWLILYYKPTDRKGEGQ